MPLQSFNTTITNLHSLFDNDKREVEKILSLLAIRLEQLQTCFERKNIEEIKIEAHKIKSELAVCGFEELSAQASQIEMLARENQIVRSKIVEFNSAADELVLEIEKYLAAE